MDRRGSTLLVCAVLALAVALGAGRLAGWTALTIASRSMAPAVPFGSLIVVREVPSSEVGIGDVVTMTTTWGPMTRRVVASQLVPGGRAFTLRGDANPAPDAESMMFVDRAGLVVATIPYAGYVALLIGGSGVALVATAALAIVVILLLRPADIVGREEISARTFTREAAELLRGGERDRAIEALRRAVPLSPADLRIHRRLAAMLLNAGDLEGASAENVRYEAVLRARGRVRRADAERDYFEVMASRAAGG